MKNDGKRVHWWNCYQCKCKTPFKEDAVTDKEHATVWHCMYCGNERPPTEPNDPNEPVLAK